VPRPSFKPTKEQRKMVKSLATIGMRHDHIASVIGIRSPKTIRKHFRKELSLGAAEALAAVTRVAYEMAVSGKYPEMIEYCLDTMHLAAEWPTVSDADQIERSPNSTCELIFAPSPAAQLENAGGKTCLG
jgi:hypothetical protein